MKHRVIYALILVALLTYSCSIQEECLETPRTEMNNKVSVIAVSDTLGVLSRIQSNPYVVLMSHISLEGGKAVLNILPEESCSLRIDEADYLRVANYVESLNNEKDEK